MNKIVGTGLLSVGLVVGLAGFAGATSGSIGTTGPDSNNQIKHESSTKLDVDNNNNLDLTNDNHQDASSGNAKVRDNTSGGDAQSGNVGNTNSLDATVAVDNSGSTNGLGMGSGNGGSDSATISNTGPDSKNEVKFENKSAVTVDNNNDVHVSNTNNQTATSGNAEVSHNTTGGSATSGSAMNTSSSSFTIRLTN